MKDSVRVTKKRHFRPHAEFYHAAKIHLDDVVTNRQGWFYYGLSSLLMTAFSFEAYMNFVGSRVEPGWEDFDRATSTLGKFRLIARIIGYPLDFSKTPDQTVEKLFKFRNRVAHPRDEKIEEQYLSTPENYQDKFYKTPHPKWMMFPEVEDIKRCHEDVGTIIRAINRLLPNPEAHPLTIDMGSGSTTIEIPLKE